MFNKNSTGSTSLQPCSHEGAKSWFFPGFMCAVHVLQSISRTSILINEILVFRPWKKLILILSKECFAFDKSFPLPLHMLFLSTSFLVLRCFLLHQISSFSSPPNNSLTLIIHTISMPRMHQCKLFNMYMLFGSCIIFLFNSLTQNLFPAAG